MSLHLATTDVQEISEMIYQASSNVTCAYADSPSLHTDLESMSPNKIATALNQFMDIMHMIESSEQDDYIYADTNSQVLECWGDDDHTILDSGDITEIGNYALDLMQTLNDWAISLNLPKDQHQLEEAMVIISLWIARHGGALTSLETVVDTLAGMANTTSEPHALAELSQIMGELIGAVSHEVRHNINHGDPNKIWKMLNINRGIVATRTNDPLIMEPVFDQLVSNIPDAAAVFFEEGMQQITALDYPQHVREVMNRYYQTYCARVLH